MTEHSLPTIDLAALKARQQATWASGDYAIVGTTLQIVGEELCEALDLRAGQKVLDVAAGNGNATLAAARRWCEVISTDYVPSLLERGRARATAEGLSVQFKEADAEALDFGDATFDAVLSTFGVMFTPDQDKAASELARVCRSGGKIGLASWTPEGFIGQMFKTVGSHMPPPPPELKPPTMWGNEDHVRGLFGALGVDLQFERNEVTFEADSPEAWLEYNERVLGPMVVARAALEPQGKWQALHDDLLAMYRRLNQNTDGTLRLTGEYLVTIARVPA